MKMKDIQYLTNLSPGHFIFNLCDHDDHWQVRVLQHNVAGTKEQIVKLPKSPVNGSYFGACTCGSDELSGGIPADVPKIFPTFIQGSLWSLSIAPYCRDRERDIRGISSLASLVRLDSRESFISWKISRGHPRKHSILPTQKNVEIEREAAGYHLRLIFSKSDI
jgi:hypothetical protein